MTLDTAPLILGRMDETGVFETALRVTEVTLLGCGDMAHRQGRGVDLGPHMAGIALTGRSLENTTKVTVITGKPAMSSS